MTPNELKPETRYTAMLINEKYGVDGFQPIPLNADFRCSRCTLGQLWKFDAMKTAESIFDATIDYNSNIETCMQTCISSSSYTIKNLPFDSCGNIATTELILDEQEYYYTPDFSFNTNSLTTSSSSWTYCEDEYVYVCEEEKSQENK